VCVCVCACVYVLGVCVCVCECECGSPQPLQGHVNHVATLQDDAALLNEVHARLKSLRDDEGGRGQPRGDAPDGPRPSPPPSPSSLLPQVWEECDDKCGSLWQSHPIAPVATRSPPETRAVTGPWPPLAPGGQGDGRYQGLVMPHGVMDLVTGRLTEDFARPPDPDASLAGVFAP
jgi:hypothetical protein